MEKKAYISPALTAYVLNIADSILALSAGEDLKSGGDTGTHGVTNSDTKSSGSWNVWSSDDE